MRKIKRVLGMMLMLVLIVTSVPQRASASHYGVKARSDYEYDGSRWLERYGWSDPKHTTVDTVKYTYGQEDKIKYYITEKTKTAEVDCNFQLRVYSNFGKDKKTTLVKSETADHKRIADIVSWKSTNPSVAIVDVTGYVEPLSAGTTTIKASFKVGGETKTLKCKLTVTDTPVTVREIETYFNQTYEDCTKEIANYKSLAQYRDFMAEHGDDYATVEDAVYVIYCLLEGTTIIKQPAWTFNTDWLIADDDMCSNSDNAYRLRSFFASGLLDGHLVAKDAPSFDEFKAVYVPSGEYVIDPCDERVMVACTIKNDYEAFLNAFGDRFKRNLEPQKQISRGYAEKIIDRVADRVPCREFTFNRFSGAYNLNWRERPLMLHEGLEYASSMAELFGWSWAETESSDKRYASIFLLCDGMSRAFLRDMTFTKAEWKAMDTSSVFLTYNGKRQEFWRDDLNPWDF